MKKITRIQLTKDLIIITLKELGYSLSEIKEVFKPITKDYAHRVTSGKNVTQKQILKDTLSIVRKHCV